MTVAPAHLLPDLAQRLLDAQVAFHVDQLSGPEAADTIRQDVHVALTLAADMRLDALIGPADVSRIAGRLATAVPGSTTASTMIGAIVDLLLEGPSQPTALGDVLSREHVAALIEEVLALHPSVERGLEQLTDSPLVGTLASRFITRIALEVLEINRSVAGRIPGVGSIVSMGTNAATKVVGAADRQLGQLVGDTAGKGAAFALRRLNRIVVDTMQDPLLRDAALEVWDQHAQDPLGPLEQVVDAEQAHRIASLLQQVAIDIAPDDAAGAMADRIIESFFAIYGEHTLATLLDELGVELDDVVAEVTLLAAGVIEEARASGQLAQAIRDRLTAFYGSAEVAALIAAG